MSRLPDPVITVSPPNLDRTGFLTLEMDLDGGDGPLDRDGLLERFGEGLQVRMLRPPLRGYVEFAPGRATWRPVIGAERSVVVHALRVAGHADWDSGAGQLLASAEHWARYFGFAALLLPSCGTGLAEVEGLRRRGYTLLEHAQPGARGRVGLWIKVFQGPMRLPSFPRDWQARAQRLGPGLVVQSAGHCSRHLACGYELIDRARANGLEARLHALRSASEAREHLVTPRGVFAVVLNGILIDEGHQAAPELWQEICRRRRL